MRTATRRAPLLTTAAVALALIAAPAAAAPPDLASAGAVELAVEEEPVRPDQQEDPDEAPAEGVPATEEAETDGHKRPLPLDLTDPYGWFGAFLILALLAAVGFGIRNAYTQIRGERPQADGSWRWR